MAPPLLFDIDKIDLDHVLHTAEDIEKINPHRPPMRMIDGVFYENEDDLTMLAFKDIREDEFWADCHIPGRPIFPGVLMIEAAAQLASFICLRKLEGETFMGFVGVDNVKFRGMVTPGDRLLILMKQLELRRRRSVCDAQGLVDGRLVFEARITGMPM